MMIDLAARRAIESGGEVGEVCGEDGDAAGGLEWWYC
jgi:hypothetical protein